MPSNLYTNIQEINSVKQNIYNSMAAVNYPITNITSLANYSQLINNYTRNNDGYIISYNSNITNNLINSGELFNSDTIVTFDNTEIWCTDDYVVSGRKYYNLQVVNNVTLPRAITGEIKDTTSIYNRSICKYFNSTYARLNFRNGGGLTGKWVNYIWDSNDGVHYTLNTSKSSGNIFNINSPNCLNYAFIYLNGTYDWPLEYFMFDGYKLNLTSIIKINDNLPKTYNFNLTAENVIGGTKYVGMNGVTISNIEKDIIVDKSALLNRVDLYQNVPNFNTSNVTNMINMFRNCYNLTSIPNYDTSNVTNMYSIFYNCRNLTSVPNFDMSNVTNVYQMFCDCTNLTSVPNFDTNNIIYMGFMFSGCQNLTTVPNYNTSKVTSMSSMFSGCHNLTSVPNFDTSNTALMGSMFSSCNNLTSVPNFNTNNVTYMPYMFRNCTNLTTVPNYNTSNVTNMCGMFAKCQNLTSVPNFDTGNVTNMYYMFQNCNNLVSVPNFDTKNVTSMQGVFVACYNLTSVPQFNTSNIIDINMRYMFSYCNNLSDASVQNIINMCLNSNVTNANYKNLNVENANSPFYNSNITSARYSNRLSELTSAGWTY